MKRIISLHRLLLLITLLFSLTVTVSAWERRGVKVDYEQEGEGTIRVKNVWNKSDKRIDLIIDGTSFTVNPHSSLKPEIIANRFVKCNFSDGSERVWSAPKKKSAVAPEPQTPNVENINVRQEGNEGAARRKDEKLASATPVDQERTQIEERIAQAAGESSIDFLEMLNRDGFFGADAVSAYTQKVEDYCRELEDANDKPQYIIDNDLRQFLDDSQKELEAKKSELPLIAQSIVSASKISPDRQASTLNLIIETLNSRLKTREEAYVKLDTLVSTVGSEEGSASHGGGNVLNYVIVGVVVLLLVVLIVVVIKRKKGKKKNVPAPSARPSAAKSASPDEGSIVVRRRTTSILKKQCIDDVIDNPAYLVIDASDFTTDSAVRKIYIKNSCIKDVYNMYAEDLRNTENPKEDGCMVLGRWVHNEVDHTYDISLEEVVYPGDDAIFKEYELNFGGKIKLRVAEKLRKLRRDTNLQYDLVCWIHSHPGLGVFFSNSDGNVQEQLKHAQHPHFLIAFVVDILTSNQEMGIFTYRKDGSLNSKGDITKMYSLEDLYKWALQSERNSFSPDKYYNLLDNAKLKVNSCNGVEVNNSSIIDLSQIVIEPETGIVGWAVGTTVERKGLQEYVVSSIVRGEKPGAGVIGCLVSMTHMSFPTIQRLIARDSANLSFVMVYSSKQMTLTTIPVVRGELLPDEQFYGDVNIDDLKIWTRRKR